MLLRAALAVGGAIDLFVAAIALFAPALLGPLMDVPHGDPFITQVAGGELLVAAFVYAVAFRDPVRLRPLLWVCALDQAIALLIPVSAITQGLLPASLKTLGPLPLQLTLLAIFVRNARRGK